MQQQAQHQLIANPAQQLAPLRGQQGGRVATSTGGHQLCVVEACVGAAAAAAVGFLQGVQFFGSGKLGHCCLVIRMNVVVFKAYPDGPTSSP